MTAKHGPAHVVVDGSNIATEGRSTPSLQQLSEAVASFMEEHPDTAITVVVDATFGHRIDKKEVNEFEAGIANNELVAPPAGAVGRGDAFVLGIADKSGATVLSNDSFQEFHADYEWLFDDGRLIGGKPVPHVGWVWVERNPVRGPVSRKATRGAGKSSRSGRGRGRKDDRTVRVGSADANEPMPVPKTPPPSTSGGSKQSSDEPTDDTTETTTRERTGGSRRRGADRQSTPRGKEPINELLPFLEFVEHHPIGTSVNGTVDSYSSHGAYITIGDDGVRGYVPLRMMADPPPRSAKSTMKIGESVTVVVASFAPARRSIDCALPDMAEAAIAAAAAEAASDAAAKPAEAPAKKTAAKKTAAKKTATAKKAPAKKSAAKKPAATKASAKRAAAKKTAAKKPAAKKPAAKKPAAKKPAAKKTAAKKTAAKKTAAKKTATKKTATKRAATKTAANTTAAKKAGARKVASKRAPVKRVAAKRAPVKKVAAAQAAASPTEQGAAENS